MKFVQKTKHAKKYVYHKFCLEVPELAQLFEKDGEDWVKKENEFRREQIDDLKSDEHWGDKKTKKKMKADLKELEKRLKTDLKPATSEDWKKSDDVTTQLNATVNKLTGTFELIICRPMDAFDKLRGANSRKNAGVRRWQDVVVKETAIPDALPVTPMNKEEKEEADEKIAYYR